MIQCVGLFMDVILTCTGMLFCDPSGFAILKEWSVLIIMKYLNRIVIILIYLGGRDLSLCNWFCYFVFNCLDQPNLVEYFIFESMQNIICTWEG